MITDEPLELLLLPPGFVNSDSLLLIPWILYGLVLNIQVKEIGELKKELECSSQKLDEMRLEHQSVWEKVNYYLA